MGTVGRRAALIARGAGLGLTQEDLATVVGVERTTVARWEAGTCTPQPLHRLRLAEALGVSPFELDLLLAGLTVDGEPAEATRRPHQTAGMLRSMAATISLAFSHALGYNGLAPSEADRLNSRSWSPLTPACSKQVLSPESRRTPG